MRAGKLGLVVWSAMVLVGCGQSALVGKWLTPSGESLELLDGGALILQKDQNSISGHWEALDSTRVALRFDNFGSESVVCVFRAESNDLIFNDCRLAGRLTRQS